VKRVKVKITAKGQISIPASYRHKYNIEKGDLLTVKESGDSLILSPEKSCDKDELEKIYEELKGAWRSMETNGAEYVRSLRKGGTRDVW